MDARNNHNIERKVGEIFKYHGEWYQCVKGKICSCVGCAFYSEVCCTSDFFSIFGKCKAGNRSDSNFVIFKKLTKEGEPFEYNGVYYQEYKTFTKSIIVVDGYYIIGTAHGFAERIEQNSDIDEKTMTLEDLVNDYIDGKIVYSEFKNKVKNLHNKDMKTNTTIENIGKNMKPFNLEAAKSGKPVCTRDGRKARIICFDYKGDYGVYPILALISTTNQCGVPDEIIAKYTEDGKYARYISTENNEDLMMVSEKREGWTLLQKNGCTFDSKEIAEKNCTDDYFVAKVEWEE